MNWIFYLDTGLLKKEKKVTVWDFQSSKLVHFGIYKGPDTLIIKLNKHFKSMISRLDLTSASLRKLF